MLYSLIDILEFILHDEEADDIWEIWLIVASFIDEGLFGRAFIDHCFTEERVFYCLY